MSDCCGGGFPSASWPTLAGLATPWVAPTLLNSWVNFGGGEQDLQYRKLWGDMVHIRGVVKSGTIGAAIATLPVGFRPPFPLGFAVSSAGAVGTLVIQPNGTLLTTNGSNVSFHTNVLYSIV